MSASRAGSPLIIPVPTIRESGVLALSSRNRFIAPADRPRAMALSRALAAAQDHTDPVIAERAMRDTLTDSSLEIEYAVIRDAETLEAPRPNHPARALIAARLAPIRLIDNAPWPRGV